MRTAARSSDARAMRLLRWYPKAWRARYGEELAQLLADDIAERPHSPRRTVDTAVTGLTARLSLVGLGAGPIGRTPSALAAAWVAGAVFVACGLSLWAQLLVGWRAAPPDGRPVAVSLLTMTLAVAYLGVLAALAVTAIAVETVRSARAGNGRRLVLPLGLLAGGVGALTVGGDEMAVLTPTAGGPAWRWQSLVPSHLADLGRAETLSISTYWAHPHHLATLPGAELAWMVASPFALAAAVLGLVLLLRRTSASRRLLRRQARLARAATVGMLPFLLVGGWWVLTSRTGTSDIFRAGLLDLALIACMAASLGLLDLASRQSVRATRLPGGCAGDARF